MVESDRWSDLPRIVPGLHVSETALLRTKKGWRTQALADALAVKMIFPGAAVVGFWDMKELQKKYAAAAKRGSSFKKQGYTEHAEEEGGAE